MDNTARTSEPTSEEIKSLRALVPLTRERLGEEKGSSRFLYRLFPDGPGTQACRYAGLPRPLSCV